MRHLLDQYVGAYGSCLTDLHRVMTSTIVHDLVNEKRHAMAFTGDSDSINESIATVIKDLGVGSVLDLGSGAGHLLIMLAQEIASFVGVGVDSNSAMIELARTRASERGLSERISFFHGDLLDVITGWSDQRRESIDFLTASSVFNAYFQPPSGDRAVSLLLALKAAFPNRFLLISDYYGRLGHAHSMAAGRRTMLHDLAQLVSGQGVPPPDLAGWSRVYDQTKCNLLGTVERWDSEIHWFLHLIQL
jgi:SAM-dependent methyltransferase